MKKVFALTVIALVLLISLNVAPKESKSQKSTIEESVAGISVLLDQLTADEISNAYNEGVN